MSMHWKQRPEGGARFALWVIRSVGRYGGRPLARALLYPTTLYFLLRRGPERRASLAYLARVLDHRPTWWDVARHIHTFASTILDRVFMLSGELERFDIQVNGLEGLHQQIDRGRGVLVFGSHLGSFDALRVLACQRPDVTVRVVLDKAHNQAMQHMLDALNPELARNIIDAGMDGPSIVLAIQQAASEGALVALLVDRLHPGEPRQRVEFLGDTAALPTTPWLIAATLKVPVVLAFGLYRGGNRYQLDFEVFSEGLDIPRHNRREQLAQLVPRYAQRLEHHARRAPYNWFNFFDFWHNDDATPLPPAVAAPVADRGERQRDSV